MYLTEQQTEAIHKLAIQLARSHACIWLFGSKLDDAARGKDCNLMLELIESVDNPALLVAKYSAKVSRLMHGCRQGRRATFCTQSDALTYS